MSVSRRTVGQLSDGELIDMVIEKVWANCGDLTLESALVSEVIQRLMHYSGLPSTPRGALRDDYGEERKRWNR
jgi:hypothetical protein